MKGCSYWSWLIIAAAAVIFSCARQAAPSGGPDDTSPPKIVKSVPLKSSRNFKGKNIVITFDEYVVLDKMTDKFMVSPPLNKKPEIFLRGKSLNIEFKEDLKDSTTYTLYFQDAIKDLNAANPLMNFQFVPGGRIISNAGIGLKGTTYINCFTSDMNVLTKKG